MAGRSDWLRRERQQAWAFGCDLRDSLLRQYQQECGSSTPPPPALIAGELLTDFLGVRLTYDELPLDRYAETRLIDGRPHISINDRIAEMPNVKDADGVANVAKWHEGMHVVRDLSALREGPQGMLPGIEVERKIVCYRTPPSKLTSAIETNREWFAEEAGRAAAVSLAALKRTDPFQRLMTWRGEMPRATGWGLLYAAAEAIGVNISALVTQLGAEGLIALIPEDGKNRAYVQPALLNQMEVV